MASQNKGAASEGVNPIMLSTIEDLMSDEEDIN